MAVKIFQRINEIKSIDTIENLVKFGFGRCHALEGNRSSQYAMDLVHPYRLVFISNDDTLQVVKIIDITDYH